MSASRGAHAIPAAEESSAIDPAIVQQAAEWMARLWSGDVSEADKAACAAWRTARAAHEQAWQRLQAVEQKLCSAPAGVARHALYGPAPAANAARRRALRLLFLGVTVGGLGHLIHGTDAWTLATADHGTATGEIRSLTLPDGTQLVLASASAVDVRFTGRERLIELRTGEILVTSAPDPAPLPRPLRVRSRHGTVQALGTRFTVRQDSRASRVEVFEGAVEIRPAGAGHGAVRISAGHGAVRISAGHGARYTAEGVHPPARVQESSAAWSRGMLVADAMRLDEFVAELARYRPGLLRCDPAVAGLRVTGVFSLQDTDRALHNLTLGLPVAITYRTRYWATVHAN